MQEPHHKVNYDNSEALSALLKSEEAFTTHEVGLTGESSRPQIEVEKASITLMGDDVGSGRSDIAQPVLVNPTLKAEMAAIPIYESKEAEAMNDYILNSLSAASEAKESLPRQNSTAAFESSRQQALDAQAEADLVLLDNLQKLSQVTNEVAIEIHSEAQLNTPYEHLEEYPAQLDARGASAQIRQTELEAQEALQSLQLEILTQAELDTTATEVDRTSPKLKVNSHEEELDQIAEICKHRQNFTSSFVAADARLSSRHMPHISAPRKRGILKFIGHHITGLEVWPHTHIIDVLKSRVYDRKVVLLEHTDLKKMDIDYKFHEANSLAGILSYPLPATSHDKTIIPSLVDQIHRDQREGKNILLVGDAGRLDIMRDALNFYAEVV